MAEDNSEVIQRLTNYFAPANTVKPTVATPSPSPAQEPVAAPEDVQPESSAESSEEVPDQPAEEDQAPEDPLEELTHLGKNYKVPASLKKAFEENRSAFGRQSAEAKKLEETAAQVVTQRQLLEAEARFRQESKDEFDKLAQLEYAESYWKKQPWGEMDTETYMRSRASYDQVKEMKADLEKELGKKAQEFQSRIKQTVAESLQKGYEYLQKAIPNFSDQTVADIKAFGRSIGFTNAELDSITDPRAVHVLYKGMMADKALSGKSAALKKSEGAPPVVKPGSSLSQPTTASRRLREMRTNLRKSGDPADFEAILRETMK